MNQKGETSLLGLDRLPVGLVPFGPKKSSKNFGFTASTPPLLMVEKF